MKKDIVEDILLLKKDIFLLAQKADSIIKNFRVFNSIQLSLEHFNFSAGAKNYLSMHNVKNTKDLSKLDLNQFRSENDQEPNLPKNFPHLNDINSVE